MSFIRWLVASALLGILLGLGIVAGALWLGGFW